MNPRISIAIVGGMAAAGLLLSSCSTQTTQVPEQGTEQPTPAGSVGSTEGSFDSTEQLAPGVAVAVVSVERTTISGEGPGSVSGSGARFEIRVTNKSGQPVDVSSVIVNAVYGPDQKPADPVDDNLGLTGSIGPNDSATGVYSFRIPSDQLGDVALWIEYLPGSPVVVLSGAVV